METDHFRTGERNEEPEDGAGRYLPESSLTPPDHLLPSHCFVRLRSPKLTASGQGDADPIESLGESILRIGERELTAGARQGSG